MTVRRTAEMINGNNEEGVHGVKKKFTHLGCRQLMQVNAASSTISALRIKAQINTF